jgi:nitrate/TMAO reductase-like tetraheme cytochrome c subunit
MGDLTRRWLLPLLYLTDNWISRLGLWLVLSSVVLWIFLTGASAASGYIGILQFVALPVAFFGGLALIPIGISIQRKKEAPDHHLHLPEKIDLANPKIRRLLIFVTIATGFNLIVGGALTYRTVHYMETTNFCGTACHQAMGPEYAAHIAGSHAQVRCVECHVGEGAEAAIRAKLNGTRQLYLLLTNSFSRPIPSPPHALKTSTETCENCHNRNHDFGNVLRRSSKFDDNGDRLDTALMLKLGAIHRAHMGPGISIRYKASDPLRKTIVAVQMTRGQESIDYLSPDASKAVFEREMDCLDCHNRPAHAFDTAEGVVDREMTNGALPQKIPLFRKAALEVLKRPYKSREEAAAQLPAALLAYYQSTKADALAANRADLEKAGAKLLALYQLNVYPEMKLGWGNYPKHNGHTDSPGCFRCHADDLRSKAGKTIGQDCESCHKVLGVEEKDIAALKELGGL